jgi:orotidine-5'-phosphate decarboxylase
MNFIQKLDLIIGKNNSLVCVGLDSDIDKIPEFLKNKKHAQFIFNKKIIDSTYDLVCSYKLNSAFFEALGEMGIKQLKLTCDYLNKKYPQIPIILDAKRADIGSTNNGYVKYAFEYLNVDAITLNPYLGQEALLPFLNCKDKGCIVLCRTSNPGAGEFQDLKIKNKFLYQIISQNIVKNWNINHNCLLVVGATNPHELKEVRKIVGHMTILVPGIGAQGGDLEKTLKYGLNSLKKGLIINSSRGIIFRGKGKDFDKQARKIALEMRDIINKFR